MKCELLFYMANGTGINQDALVKALSSGDSSIGTVSFSTNAAELGYALADAVSHSNVLFIVGGLSQRGPFNILQVLSRILSLPMQTLPMQKGMIQGAKVMENAEGEDGCMIESGRQSIFVLPDSPEQLTKMLYQTVFPCLSQKYGITFAPCEDKGNEIIKRLEQEIQPPVVSGPTVLTSAAYRAKRRGKIAFKVLIILLSALLVLGLIYSYYHFLSF